MLLLSIALFAMADTPPVTKKPKPICRTSQTTGSRLGGTQVCMTREQWEVADREARATMDKALENNNQRGTFGGRN